MGDLGRAHARHVDKRGLTVKETVRAAIIAAVNAYMVEEAKEAPPSPVPTLIPSPWKVFGLQELMRKRASIQKRVQR